MIVKREDCNRFETDLRSAWNPNQIMKWFDEGKLKNNIVLTDLCMRVKRSNREMFPALGILYTTIAGQIPVMMDGGKVEVINIPHKFMTSVMMNSWYASYKTFIPWYEDRDYTYVSDWSPATYVDRCDDRILDPTWEYGLYINAKYGRSQPTFGTALHMKGGDAESVDDIIEDVSVLIETFYQLNGEFNRNTHGRADMIGQDLVRSYKEAIPKWLSEVSASSTELLSRYPELRKYVLEGGR